MTGSPADRAGSDWRPRAAVAVEVALEVRRDAEGRDTARVRVREGGLDFGVVPLQDVPLLLEALLVDARPS